MSSLTYFYPYISDISSITQSNPVVITTSSAHGLLSGNIVRISTVYNGSMPQINGQQGLATVLSPTTISMSINSTNYDAFVQSSTQSAQLVPIAELNATLQNAEQLIGPNTPLS
jgi:hypothetical protein